MDKFKGLKIAGVLLTVVGAGVSIASGQIDSKLQDQAIKKAVAEEVAKIGMKKD